MNKQHVKRIFENLSQAQTNREIHSADQFWKIDRFNRSISTSGTGATVIGVQKGSIKRNINLLPGRSISRFGPKFLFSPDAELSISSVRKLLNSVRAQAISAPRRAWDHRSNVMTELLLFIVSFHKNIIKVNLTLLCIHPDVYLLIYSHHQLRFNAKLQNIILIFIILTRK